MPSLSSKAFKAALATLVVVFGDVRTAGADPWNQHVQKVAVLDAQIGGLEKEIIELIAHQRTLEGAGDVKALLAAMTQKHRLLEAAASERASEIAEMRFKHPEKGDLTKRDYARYVVRTLEEMDPTRGLGLDGKLTRLKRDVEAKYHVEARDRPAPPKAPAPSAPAAADEDRITVRK